MPSKSSHCDKKSFVVLLKALASIAMHGIFFDSHLERYAGPSRDRDEVISAVIGWRWWAGGAMGGHQECHT